MNITRETAARIAYAHDEITAAEKLMSELEDAERNYRDPDFRDSFGRQRGLQLGVPSGESSRRLFNVSPRLAKTVIQSFIYDKQAEIRALCELAARELAAPAPLESETAIP